MQKEPGEGARACRQMGRTRPWTAALGGDPHTQCQGSGAAPPRGHHFFRASEPWLQPSAEATATVQEGELRPRRGWGRTELEGTFW